MTITESSERWERIAEVARDHRDAWTAEAATHR